MVCQTVDAASSIRARSNTTPKVPQLVNLSNVGKLSKMMKNFQPGMMVHIPQMGEVHSILMASKWDNFVFYRGKNYHTYLMGEFYANLVTQKDSHGLFTLHRVVNKKHITIDVNSIANALRLEANTFNQPCINIYEQFAFDKEEFKILVGFFCESEVPEGLCDENCGICFMHFTPTYQQLAKILRANMLPKPNHDQFFDFIDLKVMFQLVSNKVEFNLGYVIILNMFLAYQLDSMPYGLLLTSLFDINHIPMPRVYTDRVLIIA